MRIVNGSLKQAKKRSIQFQDIALQPTSGTLTSKIDPMLQDRWLPSCFMCLQCRARRIQEAALENVAALQRYLEELQFEANTLRMWSNGIHDEIMEEAQKVHIQMMRMIREL